MIADFRRKGKNEVSQKKILLQVGCLVAGVALVILIIADIKIYNDKKIMIAKINAYQNQIADIQKSSDHLQQEIANANNKDYLEKMAYEQLNQQRPGEKEFIFVSAPDKTSPKNNSSTGLFGWIANVWNWLKAKPEK